MSLIIRHACNRPKRETKEKPHQVRDFNEQHMIQATYPPLTTNQLYLDTHTHTHVYTHTTCRHGNFIDRVAKRVCVSTRLADSAAQENRGHQQVIAFVEFGFSFNKKIYVSLCDRRPFFQFPKIKVVDFESASDHLTYSTQQQYVIIQNDLDKVSIFLS